MAGWGPCGGRRGGRAGSSLCERARERRVGQGGAGLVFACGQRGAGESSAVQLALGRVSRRSQRERVGGKTEMGKNLRGHQRREDAGHPAALATALAARQQIRSPRSQQQESRGDSGGWPCRCRGRKPFGRTQGRFVFARRPRSQKVERVLARQRLVELAPLAQQLDDPQRHRASNVSTSAPSGCATPHPATAKSPA